MIESVQWIGILITAFNGLLAFIDKMLYKYFLKTGATTPQTAIKIETLAPLFRWRLHNMRYAGIIYDKYSNRYFYAENLHKMINRKRRIRLFMILSFTLILVISFV